MGVSSTSKQNIGKRTLLSDVRKKKKYIEMFGSFTEPLNCYYFRCAVVTVAD